ncbi:hypothetical protein [Legionella fallonii]|uniref:Uncharacterized protein n=1 Tax=Legionella fallonii LLAP-10 TaxID=1212491 RepID=A0A098G6X4_9GAMM|nr:hypothetical protein [Legionella fallonii]CEG57245.1 membrane protein of unknown function [Legionella fallonii LLAP-10]
MVMKRNKNEPGAHWSVKTCFWTALGIILLSAIIVILFVHKAVWVELETLALIIGIMTTFFYSYILYHGVRFLDGERITFRRVMDRPLEPENDVVSTESFGYFTSNLSDEGLIGILFGLILDILTCFMLASILSVLMWFGVNLIAVSIFIVATPLYYIFSQSLRFVMRHVEECRGNFVKSVQYGLGYALLKTATLCLIVFVSHDLAKVIKRLVLGG